MAQSPYRLHGFNVGDSADLARVEELLDTDLYYGIGELFFHGHAAQIDATTEDVQVELFRLAAEAGVPVMVHWDMMAVEDDSTTDGQHNYEQFEALMQRLDNEGIEVNVIIAHLGVGPYTPSVDDALVPDWYTNVFTELLKRDNVFFDLGGMQLGSWGSGYPVLEQLYFLTSPNDLTELGKVVKTEMEDKPERFLLGTDVETRSETDFTDADGGGHHGTTTYADSVDYYRTFLSKCSLSADEVAAIRIWNAEDLYGLP